MSVMLRRDAGAGVPWIVIDPTSSRPLVEVRELWHYRDLLYFLTWRDISVRYKQTVLGFLWAILQPFLTMVVFAIFLCRLAGMPSPGGPYPLFSSLALFPSPLLMPLRLVAHPVVYPRRLVPPGWQPLFALNPMTGIIDASRAAVLGTALDWPSLGISALSAAVLAALGAWQFHRMEQSFADQV